MKKSLHLLVMFLIILPTALFPQSPSVQQILDSVNLDSLMYFVRELSGDVPTIINGTSQTILSRNTYQPGNALAETYIEQKLQSYGLATIIQSFNSKGNNVLATQVGTVFPNRKYIICAHYDDMPPEIIAPGADDNASGTAAVIEAARIFSQYTFPFTIVYALWDEEEQGLHGSNYYAIQAANAGDSIICVINLDMIAYDSNSDDVCSLYGSPVGLSIDLSNKMVKINAQYGINLNVVSSNAGGGASDHASFWNNGYSAIMLEEFGGDFNQYYHTAHDHLQYFNQQYFNKLTKLALGTLADISINYIYGNIFAEQPFVDKPYAKINIDQVIFRTKFSSIHNHQFTPHLIYTNLDSTQSDSLALLDDGAHGDLLAADGIFGNIISPRPTEDFYILSTSTVDHQTNEYINLPDICRFTTAGPAVLDSISYKKGLLDWHYVRPFVHNWSNSTTIKNAQVKMSSKDPWITSIGQSTVNLPDIPPGKTVGATSWCTPGIIDSLFPGYINFKAEIISDGWTYWEDSIQVVITGVENEVALVSDYKLEQNYPNPFNPSTKISWQSPIRSQQTLKIYDILGREKVTLMNEENEAGYHSVDFNATNLPSGVYFYQLKAGNFIETKKMVYIR